MTMKQYSQQVFKKSFRTEQTQTLTKNRMSMGLMDATDRRWDASPPGNARTQIVCPYANYLPF